MRKADRKDLSGVRSACNKWNHKTVVFIKNKNDPSSYYRIYQYLSECKEIQLISYASDRMYSWYYGLNGAKTHRKNTKIGSLCRKSIFAVTGIVRISAVIIQKIIMDNVKIVVINREIYPRIFPFPLDRLLLRFLKGKRIIWDLDDNIFLDREITKREDKILQNAADTILVSNSFLKNQIPEEYHNKVQLLNTSDRIFEQSVPHTYTVLREKSYRTEINLLWIGTKDNLEFLQNICTYLENTAEILWKRNGKRLILRCVCNKRLEWKSEYLRIYNIVWTRDRAVKELYSAHIGLMPLTVNQYTMGKSGFKAVQYCGAGLPVLASDAGFNSEIIQNRVNGFLIAKKEDWNHKLIELSTNFSGWQAMSEQSRQIWNQKFDTRVQEKLWRELLHGR